MDLFNSKSVLRVPASLQILGDRIIGFYGDGPLSFDPEIVKKMKVRPAVLDDFLRIADDSGGINSDGNKIVEFAQRYGFLNARFRSGSTTGRTEETKSLQPVPEKDGIWYGEKLQDWAVIHWEVQDCYRRLKSIQNGKLRPVARRRAIQEFTERDIRLLLSETDLRPTLAWSEEREAWSLVVGSYTADGVPGFTGALAAIVYFLVQAALHPDDTALCSLCHKWYTLDLDASGIPLRWPTESKNNYCQHCRGSKEMHAHIKRAYRARKAAE